MSSGVAPVLAGGLQVQFEFLVSEPGQDCDGDQALGPPIQTRRSQTPAQAVSVIHR